VNIVIFTIARGRHSQLQRAGQLFQRAAQQYFSVYISAFSAKEGTSVAYRVRFV